MSLIGPRPERPFFVTKLEQVLPRYRERLLVRPGITGFAQVQLPPDIDTESARQKLSYDLYYVAAIGPWLDFRIAVSTALKMIGVSFSVLRILFALPTRSAVELYLKRQDRPNDAAGATLLSIAAPAIEPVQAQLQPA
jgi:lipopolysaccharide/colanic/teichoic acid biosynthesis glycosyltransferase